MSSKCGNRNRKSVIKSVNLLSKCGVMQVSGYSPGHFKCKWTIKRFLTQVGNKYQSEVFEVEEKGVKWHMGIQENSCYISIDDTIESVKGVIIKCRLSLQNNNGKAFFCGNSGELEITANGHGYLKTGILWPELDDDCLVVTVEATYCIIYAKDDAEIYLHAEITPISKLPDDLKKLRISQKKSDCVISVAGKDIRVQSAVLGARSKFFSAMFRHETLEKVTCRVEVTDFEKDTIVSFLEFIYTGCVRHMDFDLAMELLRASDKYEVSDLKSYCSNYLLSIVKDYNVCQILVGADIYYAENLRKHALKYFCKNMSEDFFESQRSIFNTRPNLLCDIVKGLINEKLKLLAK